MVISLPPQLGMREASDGPMQNILAAFRSSPLTSASLSHPRRPRRRCCLSRALSVLYSTRMMYYSASKARIRFASGEKRRDDLICLNRVVEYSIITMFLLIYLRLAPYLILSNLGAPRTYIRIRLFGDLLTHLTYTSSIHAPHNLSVCLGR